MNHCPQVLTDIANFLKEKKIEINEKVEGEGRGGSLKDEGSIKRALFENEKFKDLIIDESARKFGDMIVLDYDRITRHPVNIKTSIGSTDNCFSKAGIVYAFTDIPDTEIPKAMNFKKMNDLIKTRGKDIPNRDYWFLCVDKNDSSNVLIRGAKQINCWVVNINPSNVLQVNWTKEKALQPKLRTYDEAFEVILGGVKKSLNEFWKNIPDEWKVTDKPLWSNTPNYNIPANMPIFNSKTFQSWSDDKSWKTSDSWGPHEDPTRNISEEILE